MAGSGRPTAQIEILTRSATGVAPEGFAFGLTLDGFDAAPPQDGEIYDPQLHDIYYFWDFNDSYDFAAPENLVPQFRNSGVAYGARASHVFRTPGTFDVSCLVVEPASGKSAIATLSVTVGDPDELFTDGTNIYIDQRYNGVDPPENAPEGAQIFRDFTVAMERAIIGQSGRPRRIILARDQRHVINVGLAIGFNFITPSFCIVADKGPGANPVLDMSRHTFLWDYAMAPVTERDFRFENIDFVGSWDATTQTGGQQTGFFIRQNPPKQTLFDGCSFDGFDIAIYPNATGKPKISPDPYIFINDSVITNWRSTAMFGDGINLCITGNRITQHPEALNGFAAGGNSVISAMRVMLMDNAIIAHNDLFSRTGWFVNIPSIYTTQACIRLSTTAYEGAYHNVNCNAMEGGFTLLSINNSNGEDGVAINAVVEKNVFVGSHDTKFMVDISYGGTTLRNNVGIFPDTPSYGIMPDAFVTYVRQGNDAKNQNAPQKVYSNTFVNLQSDAKAADGAANATRIADAAIVGYTNFTVENNLNYQPLQGVTDDGPLDRSVLWAPRYTHYEDEDTPRNTAVATPRDTIALYEPLEGSAAIGDALIGEVAHDDFFGNKRPMYPSRGAFEAS